MAMLNTAPNIARPDELYGQLIGLHEGLDDAASAVANAKLIMLLANHIGDAAVIGQAIALAHKGTRFAGRECSDDPLG